eukprot:8245228-Pyramimonas_sp.AAC.1
MELPDYELATVPVAGAKAIDAAVLSRVKAVLSGLQAHAGPQFSIDGSRNCWVLKPAGKSRGRGIRIYNQASARTKYLLKQSNQRAQADAGFLIGWWVQLDLIMHYIGEETPEDQFWVAQKYMENPLLVFNRKFDIRQWVLVTDWNPLT